MGIWKSGRLAGWLNIYQPANLPIVQLLLVWLLALPAATPFFQSTLPRSADGLLHLYRVVALAAALQQGAIFPRWLPDLAFGYGFPLFVYYAPLAYYLTTLLHLLGVDHTRLAYRHNGIDRRLTDVHGHVVHEILEG